MRKLLIGILMIAGCNAADTKKEKKDSPVTEHIVLTDEQIMEDPPPDISDSLQAMIDKGLKVYTQYCATCHQANGSGVPRLNPPLKGTDYVLGDKTRLINIILNGLNENIEINGNHYTNPMPAHAFLKNEQVADVLTYIRNSFGNRASGVTPAEVKAVRTK